MFAYLRGKVARMKAPRICIDVQGVGYAVTCPMITWEQIKTDSEVTVFISPYIREDRFELFGFLSEHDKEFFEMCIAQSGIGPKMGLELVNIPKSLYVTAVTRNDSTILTSIKGIGGKTAEKLLVELRTIVEKNSHIFNEQTSQNSKHHSDQDAMMALAGLGYDQKTIIHMLSLVPEHIETTEERIAMALQSISLPL